MRKVQIGSRDIGASVMDLPKSSRCEVLLKAVSINEFREVPNFHGYVMEHGHGGLS